MPLEATTPRPVMTTRRCLRSLLLLSIGMYPIRSHEHQDAIDATEAAGMAQRDIDSGVAGNIRYIVKITERIGMFLVQRGWDKLLIQNKCCDDRFDGAGSSLSMTDHRFGCADGDVISPLAKGSFIGGGLRNFIGRS